MTGKGQQYGENMENEREKTVTSPKHYEIDLLTENAAFTYKCKKEFMVIRAIGDVMDAGFISRENVDFLKYMYYLLHMKYGQMQSYEDKYFRIRYVDGEV